MSELQTALLIIGIVVIVALYAFGWWQQRQYRRKFGEAFQTVRPDTRYQTAAAGQRHATAASVEDETGEAVPPADAAAPLPDESCSLLDGRSDFIIELHLNEASPASVLDGLWQRKFDFGKPVQVCGLTLAGQPASAKWERVIAESPALYDRFRVALQLADRGGAISAAKLADFRDLLAGIAKHIRADATVPAVDEIHHHAVELDAFCASVDQMVGVNLVPPGERLLMGAKIAQSAALLGMTLESDGAFHLLDAQGHSLFSLSNRDAQPFQHHLLETFGTKGVTLLLDVPRVEDPTQHFDKLMHVAHGLARSLQVNLVDDHRVELNEAGLARIRERIAEVEEKMRARGIAPGSAQARRLFS
ncbi:MAG: hypothetical protein HY938_11275 [Nitrosomonadales bacterium]|nr:hypothetical protein [Nitrosomonadales bacterium]